MHGPDSCRPHLWEDVFTFLMKRVQLNKLPLVSSLLFGFLAHGFALTNKLVNHDEAYSMFTKGATLSSGRWGLRLMSLALPDISMPWIFGLMTLVLIAVATCFVIRTFEIKNKALQVLVAGSIMVFPSLSATMLYMFTVASYAVSFLLGTLCVWLIKDARLPKVLPALACAILSLSIYQAYIAFIASFLVLVLIRDLLHGAQTTAVFRKGVVFLLFLVASLGIYYGLTQLLIYIDGSAFNAYASSKISFRFQDIFSNVVAAYVSFVRCLLVWEFGLVPTKAATIVHLVCILSCVVLCFVWVSSTKSRSPVRIIFLLIMLALLPLASFCMYLFTSADAIHTLVLYSFASIYILFAIISDACIAITGLNKKSLIWGSLFNHILTGGMAAILVINIYVANATYLKQVLLYENVYSFYAGLIADIKEDPEFTEDTKIAIVGEYSPSWIYPEYFPFLQQTEGSYNFTPTCHAKQAFLTYFMDFSISFATDEEINRIRETEAFQSMADYPYYGSSKMIDGMFVVRLP